MERRRAIDRDGVDVRFLLNERGDGFGVTSPSRAHQRWIVRGMNKGTGGDDEDDCTRTGNEGLHSAQL
jgi:hypothetical protein